MEKTHDQAIHEMTSALLRAVNTSDLEALMSVWDDYGTLMPPGHVSVHGHQAIRAYFQELFKHSRFEFVFTSSQISIDGALAVERVEYSAAAWPLDGSSTHRDRGKGVHVYRRHESRSWRLIIDLWNSDSPGL
jgi:uncharacterized protein (TIGR02246 family)